MKRYIHASSDSDFYDNAKGRIEDVLQSDSDNSDKVSRISDILRSLDQYAVVSIARTEDGNGILQLQHTESGKWGDDFSLYSDWDIADELVNGKHRVIWSVWGREQAKPAMRTSKRNAPNWLR